MIREEIVNRIVSSGDRFEAGDLCCHAMERLGMSAETLGVYTGYSAQHIKDLALTSEVFLTPVDRRPREYLQWSHYKIAARTADPFGWIARAERGGWSTRELQRRIVEEGGKDPLVDAQRALRDVHKVIAAGGEGAEWLITRLARSPSLRNVNGNGERGSTVLRGLTASTAGPPGSGWSATTSSPKAWAGV